MNTDRSIRTLLRTPLAATAAAALLIGGASAAGASEWKWNVTPYIWATDVAVDLSLDDRRVVDKEIEFADLIEDVDYAAQVHLEAQRGKHGVMFDLFDVALSEPFRRVTLPDGAGDVLISPEAGMTILELGGVWNPRGDGQGFSLLYGTRIFNERASLEVLPPVAGASSSTFETDETLVDGLLGVRYAGRFSPRWSWIVRADASTGGTELTWSGGAALGWSFGADRRYQLIAGYRRMDVDFDSTEPVSAEMSLSGFATGLRVSF